MPLWSRFLALLFSAAGLFFFLLRLVFPSTREQYTSKPPKQCPLVPAKLIPCITSSTSGRASGMSTTIGTAR
jgi:hypothetical protein